MPYIIFKRSEYFTFLRFLKISLSNSSKLSMSLIVDLIWQIYLARVSVLHLIADLAVHLTATPFDFFSITL